MSPARHLRYAVLHHTGHGEPHFDLLFEVNETDDLLTFRSPTWPIVGETPLEPLPAHRRIYLTYEGPVSNGRGEVRAVARGTYDRVTLENGFDMLVTFQTGTDHGPVVITHDAMAIPQR